MTPRPYDIGERRKSMDAGRLRIVAAACDLLDSEGDEAFSIDAVARRAGMARMTVYNQFESKAGLVEAIFDELGARGPLSGMPAVMAIPDPFRALDEMIVLFGDFWTGNRRAHRRLRAAAQLDADLFAMMEQRNERRRRGVDHILARIPADHAMAVERDEAARVLFVLLSFQSFDAMAGDDRTPEELVPLMQRIARLIVAAPLNDANADHPDDAGTAG